MALQITNVNELKMAKSNIESAKTSFEESLEIIKNNIIDLQNYWQGNDSVEFQNEVLNIIKNDLSYVTEEMAFEIKYIGRITAVLDNAQEQVKQRLND